MLEEGSPDHRLRLQAVPKVKARRTYPADDATFNSQGRRAAVTGPDLTGGGGGGHSDPERVLEV